MLNLSAEERARRGLGRMIFITRWLSMPFYVGLLAALILVAVKFVQKLIQASAALLSQDSNDTVFAVLTLVDLTLVGNLVVIVIFAGWQTFVGRLIQSGLDEPPDLFASLGVGAVKMKIISSIIVIGAILILETFVHLDQTSLQYAAWQLAILIGLGTIGVLLAIMDKLDGH